MTGVESNPGARVGGTLYGIGVGPGDPELLTVKGAHILRSVPVVFTPVSRLGSASLAQTIAAAYLDPARQRIVPLVFAMREGLAARSERWRDHAITILGHLDTGADAAFITEGDPLLYSTFTHVARAIHKACPGARITAVPGVSSIQAAAASALIPLADADERLAILPAAYEDERLRETFAAFDTVVLLKIASAFDRVLSLLEEIGLVERAVYVARCGQAGETTVADVRSLRGQPLDYFSLLIVRKRP